MAALEPIGPSEAIDPEEALLKTMDETIYLSKNKVLKELARTMDAVRPNTTLLEIIRSNNWRELDRYFREIPGAAKFLSDLQQLLFFKYRQPGSITRKQFQIAMGIQQIVWMSDPENCLVQQLKGPAPASTFTLWEQIPQGQRAHILSKFQARLTPKYRDGRTLTSEFFNGTVWYDIKNTRMPHWNGFGTGEEYYPIPETLNFTSIANIYVPELVFGILGDISLTKHIATRSARPFIANIPTKGFCEIHGLQLNLCNMWVHDYLHSSTLYVHSVYGSFTLDDLLSAQKWSQANKKYKDPLLLAAEKNASTGDGLSSMDKLYAARYMNDTGKIWGPVETVEGGKKRASRRSRSRVSRRSRPIAASRTARRVASHLSVRKTRSNTLSALR